MARSGKKRVPDGFKVVKTAAGGYVIHHKRTGMGCMNTFMLCFWLLWTAFAVVLLYVYLDTGTDVYGDEIPLWLVLVFWGIDLWLLYYCIYYFFTSQTFRLDDFELTIQSQTLGWRWRKETVERDTITKLVQVKDGGEGEDSFPSWGVRLRAERKTIKLLDRQPYEASHWLGRVVAGWAEVHFKEAEPEN